MTQFASPSPVGPGYDSFAPAAPRRWSAAAIGGFVCSILGFFGITALLGLILGIVGIFATREGRRKGMGLAIAAIPISVVTGVLGIVVIFSFVLFLRIASQLPGRLEPVFAFDASQVDEAAAGLHKLGSPKFKEEVSEANLKDWLKNIIETNGKLTRLTIDQESLAAAQQKDQFALIMKARFVNGDKLIRVTIAPDQMWSLGLDDIEVDGSSPRDATR